MTITAENSVQGRAYIRDIENWCRENGRPYRVGKTKERIVVRIETADKRR